MIAPVLGAAIASETWAHSFRKKISCSAEDSHLLAERLLALPGSPDADISNFRKSGRRSHEGICAALLAFLDAGIMVPDPDTFILGGGTEGSRAENLLYFSSYRENPRKTGHGHLFVATLPSTPLCEIAMAFKLHGGLFYVNGNREEIGMELNHGPFPLLHVRQTPSCTAVFLLGVPQSVRSAN